MITDQGFKYLIREIKNHMKNLRCLSLHFYGYEIGLLGSNLMNRCGDVSDMEKYKARKALSEIPYFDLD